jgi:hypothetical protein
MSAYPNEQAFPATYPVDGRGMTLRDYFASRALQGLLSAEIVGDYSNAHISSIAYAIADAMIEAREAK